MYIYIHEAMVFIGHRSFLHRQRQAGHGLATLWQKGDDEQKSEAITNTTKPRSGDKPFKCGGFLRPKLTRTSSTHLV